MEPLPRLGVGIAFQAPLREVCEAPGDAFDFVEVVPDILWTDLGPSARPRHLDDRDGIEMVARFAQRAPVIPHGIGMSIGSANGLDHGHLEQLERWWRRLRFPWHSDHLAFHLVEHDGAAMNIGITLPLARDRDMLELLAPRVAEVRRRVSAPFLLENNVYYFDIPRQEMGEAEFLNALCERSGCGLLLDLHNVYTNARNHGFDPMALLAALDLRHVGEIHVAGGMEHEGWYLDAHSGVVPEPVWQMLAWTLPRCPNLGGVVFELFGSWVDSVGVERVREEGQRLRALWSTCVGGSVARAEVAA